MPVTDGEGVAAVPIDTKQIFSNDNLEEIHDAKVSRSISLIWKRSLLPFCVPEETFDKMITNRIQRV